jgi:hypothetical protein
MKQHDVIKFYFKLGKTATEVYSDVKNLYDESCSLPMVPAFQDGRKPLENEPRLGRPVSARSNEKVVKTRPTAMAGRKTTRVLDQRLGVGKEGAMKSVEKELLTRFVRVCGALRNGLNRASGCTLSQVYGFDDQARILSGRKMLAKIACQNDDLFLSIMSELSTASLFRKAPQTNGG